MSQNGVLDRYQEQFGKTGNPAPSWLARRRTAAIERFQSLGFPTTHDEDWRFTSVQSIAETPFAAAAAGGKVSAAELGALVPDSKDALRLVFVDGHWSRELSTMTPAMIGVTVQPLSAGVTTDAEVLDRHLARYAHEERNAFAALSTAFLREGALLHVGRGIQATSPLQVVFVATGGDATVSYPRMLVVLDEGAKAAVQEIYVGRGTGKYLTNAVTELVVSEGARLDHTRVQLEGETSYHIATTQSHQGRDSVLESTSIAFGAGLSRHHLGAVLGGSGGYLVLNGLSVLGGHQHVDHHTVIDHAKPHCESHELFNGVFDQHSRGVFNGRIIVRPGAQQTDSKQTSNNLLLSGDARADTQPQLEIYADDVKCTHGATLGPLDDASMFYLQSRGIPAAAARRLLTYGFGADIVSRVRGDAVRSFLDQALVSRLGQLTGAAS